jgi:hypothetical protein
MYRYRKLNKKRKIICDIINKKSKKTVKKPNTKTKTLNTKETIQKQEKMMKRIKQSKHEFNIAPAIDSESVASPFHHPVCLHCSAA